MAETQRYRPAQQRFRAYQDDLIDAIPRLHVPDRGEKLIGRLGLEHTVLQFRLNRVLDDGSSLGSGATRRS